MLTSKLVLSADQWRAMSSVRRWSIIGSLRANGPQSVSELSVELGVPPKGLYYHLRALTSVGLIQIHSSRKSTRQIEAVYEASADWFSYDAADQNAETQEAYVGAVTSILEGLAKRIHSSHLQLPVDSKIRSLIKIETANVYLAENDQIELQKRIQDLAAWAKSRNMKEGGTRVLVVGCSTPLIGKLDDLEME